MKTAEIIDFQSVREEVYSFKNNEKREGLISKLMKIIR